MLISTATCFCSRKSGGRNVRTTQGDHVGTVEGIHSRIYGEVPFRARSGPGLRFVGAGVRGLGATGFGEGSFLIEWLTGLSVPPALIAN